MAQAKLLTTRFAILRISPIKVNRTRTVYLTVAGLAILVAAFGSLPAVRFIAVVCILVMAQLWFAIPDSLDHEPQPPGGGA